ncbi:MAG: hypothetical protein Q4D07_05040 [Selenomonadaceae bacterium]|nr:hypothetical protein [Selenomonadaceae bacterium]
MAGKHAKNNGTAKSSRNLLVGGTVVALLACGCLWLFTGVGKNQENKSPEVKVGSEITGIGLLALDEAFDAHPKSGEYRRLKADYRKYSEQVARLTKSRFSPGAALPGEKPFEDAARQKHMQETIRKAIILEKRLKEEEAAYREKIMAENKAEISEIEADYENEIFNLKLKIENADVLHISEEGVRVLTERMNALKRERRDRVGIILRKYNAEIVAHLNEVRERERQELGLSAAESYEALKANEMKRRGEAINRNIDALQKQLEADIERMEKLPEAQKNLRTAERELNKLEEVMERDISSLAAKYAVIHKLQIVLVKSPRTAGIIDRISRQDMKKLPAGCDIITDTVLANGFDITKEVVEELRKH